MKYQYLDFDNLERDHPRPLMASLKKGLIFIALLLIFLFLQILSIPITHADSRPSRLDNPCVIRYLEG